MKKNNISEVSAYLEFMEAYRKSKGFKQFKAYDPYLTFTNLSNSNFLKSNGDIAENLNADTETLFNIGLDSFKYLGGYTSPLKFEKGVEDYYHFIDLYRAFLSKVFDMKVLKPINPLGEDLDLDFESLEPDQILDIVWQIYSKKQLPSEGQEEEDNFVVLYAFHALREIDNCLIGMKMDGNDAVCAAIKATQALANATAIESSEEKLIQARKDFAYRGAIERIKRDPKQIALKEIKLEYESRKSHFKRRGYTSQFVREMHSKFPIITDQKTIANLVAKLNKANESIPRNLA